MRSAVRDLLPAAVRRSQAKLGIDLSLARRMRRLTARTMAERLGVSLSTYGRIERGDAAAGIGAYAMALYVRGVGTPFDGLIDQRHDDQGLLLDAERVPRRVRPRKDAQPT